MEEYSRLMHRTAWSGLLHRRQHNDHKCQAQNQNARTSAVADALASFSPVFREEDTCLQMDGHLQADHCFVNVTA